MKDYRRWLTILALLIVTALVAIAPQSASVAPLSVQFAEYQAAPIPDTVEVLGGTRGAYGDVSHKVDANSELIMVFANENTANANETWAEVHEYNTAGTPIGLYFVNPSPGFKIDSIEVAYSCPNVKVAMTTHSYVGSRTKQVEMGTVPGIFACGQGGQVGMIMKEGGAGAYQPEPGIGGNGGPTLEEIRAVVHEEVDDALHTIVDNMIPKTKLALQQEGVLTERMFFGDQGSYSVWRQLTDTSFTGSLGALQAYFATPTPTLPQRLMP